MEFVSRVLSKFDGFAQDEYTSHCWTLKEIVSGHSEEGHPFFDYLGWFKDREKRKLDSGSFPHAVDQRRIKLESALWLVRIRVHPCARTFVQGVKGIDGKVFKAFH